MPSLLDDCTGRVSTSFFLLAPASQNQNPGTLFEWAKSDTFSRIFRHFSAPSHRHLSSRCPCACIFALQISYLLLRGVAVAFVYMPDCTYRCPVHDQWMPNTCSAAVMPPPISDLWEDYEVYSHYRQSHSSCDCHAKKRLTQFDQHCHACKEFCVNSNALHQYVPWCCVAPVLLTDTARRTKQCPARTCCPVLLTDIWLQVALWTLLMMLLLLGVAQAVWPVLRQPGAVHSIFFNHLQFNAFELTRWQCLLDLFSHRLLLRHKCCLAFSK